MHYLKEKEKEACRGLWEAVFSEESKTFTDYYFEEVVKKNRILVEEEQGEIVAMAHQNPYRLWVKDRECEIDYIVAVATRADRRKRGYMRKLMQFMLEEMEKEGKLFTFLMPASESLYAPFGFRYVYCQKFWEIEKIPERMERIETEKKSGLSEKGDGKADTVMQEISQWMQQWLKERFEVFSVRDAAYIERLNRELASERGNWNIFRMQGEIVGICAEWGLEKAEQRLFYVGNQMQEHVHMTEEKPAIMARIVSLREFVSLICLKKECQEETFEVRMRVEDEVLSQNAGDWIWKLDKKTSCIVRPQEDKTEYPVLKIGQLTEWLFGYRIPEQNELPWADKIRTLQGIFLDEVV